MAPVKNFTSQVGEWDHVGRPYLKDQEYGGAAFPEHHTEME